MIVRQTSGAICVLGRGIERVKTTAGFVWRPTRYIELPGYDGRHSGVRTPGLHLDDDVSIIAGAHANVLAAVQLFEETITEGLTAPSVIFAAGRPLYLDSEADSLTEGRVLAANFLRKLTTKDITPDICILEKNRNTRDDMRETLRLAIAKNIRRVTFVSVAVHIARAKEFLNLAVEEVEEARALSLCIEASEKILARRYTASASAKAQIVKAMKSRAYMRTSSIERQGVNALRAGTYKFK